MKEKTTSVSTSKFRSLKVLLLFTAVCLVVSNGAHSAKMSTTKEKDTVLYTLIKDYPEEETKSLELIHENGKIVKVTMWGTNDMFDNDRNGKYRPVYFVDTLSITTQRSDSLLCSLDAKRITFLHDPVPTYIHSTKEAVKCGIPVVPKEYAFLWIDSTTTFRIIEKIDTLLVDCKYYGKSKYIQVLSGYKKL